MYRPAFTSFASFFAPLAAQADSAIPSDPVPSGGRGWLCSAGSATKPGAVAAVLLLALVLRVGAAWYWDQQAANEQHLFRLGDSHSYWTLATELAQGRPYQYGSADASIFRTPVYPVVLSPFTLLTNERTAVWYARLLGCVLGTIAVGLVMILTRRTINPRAMLPAGVLAAIYPGAIGMSIVILSEAVFCPLMLIHLWLWQIAWSKQSIRHALPVAIAAGCVAGIAVLARPSWLLFTPMLFAVGLVYSSQRLRHVALCAGAILGIAIVMTPWWIRNAIVTDRFVLTTLQVGPSLYDGLHAGATGASDEGMAFMSRLVEEQRNRDSGNEDVDSTLEFRVNQYAQQMAIEWVRHNPAEAAMLALRKFQRTWSLWPNGGEVGSSILRAALTVGCFGILSLALLGSIPILSPRPQVTEDLPPLTLGFYWMPCLYFTLLHMIFVGSIRYREPALLVLTVVAGIGVDKLRLRWLADHSRNAR